MMGYCCPPHAIRIRRRPGEQIRPRTWFDMVHSLRGSFQCSYEADSERPNDVAGPQPELIGSPTELLSQMVGLFLRR